ncbi:heavy metal transporter [Streptomyces sp. NPDC050535]|uniref:heavy metal transporter n=1 Tax=Streptomyces sp. NPDC050535 TaxID=3365626 RepID=UPI00379A1509
MSEPSPTPARRGRFLRFGGAVVVLLALAGYLTVQYLTGGPGIPRCTVVSGKSDDRSYDFTPEQAVNAATISAVGTDRGMPERAVAIALATALQESGLRNIKHGDRDSLGLFQQRPSQGWGTTAEIMDPTYAADIFYEHLAKVDDYERLPLTVAAQRVQRSAFPDAYAKHEPDATMLAAALTGRSAAALTCQGPAETTPAGGTDSVRAALVRDFGRGVLTEAGADVGDAGASATPTAGASDSPTASASASPTTASRTMVLPVSADSAAEGTGGTTAVERGWELAHWAVANSASLHIERVSYAGLEWTAESADSKWSSSGASAGSDAKASTDEVRIFTGQ